jgi:hypothetical protein
MPQAFASWQRSALRAARNATAALGVGVVIGAIGWGVLEEKTRSYWSSW